MRFFGKIGYGQSEEAPTRSGIYVDSIEEFEYFGDVIRKSRAIQAGENLNFDITIGNSISIVADEYAIKHFSKIRYIRWDEVLWTVTTVEVQSPRLILHLGSVYNGPTA